METVRRGVAEGPVEEEVREIYYRGGSLPCPAGCGGAAERVRVVTTEMGGGEVWLECKSCAQRGSFELPPPTAEERAEVREAVRGGRGVGCPRHWHPVQLRRRGRDLVCPECGVLYGR